MSVNVTVNGQSAVDVTASSGDSVAVSVGSSAELVSVTVSPSGAPGPVGPQGPQGEPATEIDIGTVTTGDPGTDVVVTATSSLSGNLVTLDFTIPRGDVGADGLTPAFKIGTVTTGAAGSSASVTATTTNGGADVTLDFTIPRGNTGASGGGGGGAVSSVAGRTGAVVLTASDVSGLATVATSGSASDLASGTIPAARLPAATTKALGAVQVGSGLSITSGVLSATGSGVSWVTAPASPSSSGSAGQFAQDNDWLYACYATNSWLRVARDPWISPPGSPTITSVVGSVDAFGVGSVSVDWDPPVDNGGELTGYLVHINSEAPVSLGAAELTYEFTGLSAPLGSCTPYTVYVQAVNSAGTSSADTFTGVLPETSDPAIWNVTKTPNEMAPGVQYGVSWRPPCTTNGWNYYEVQDRLYFNGAEVVVSGDEDGWESFYSGTSSSHIADISSASSSQQYQFRVRAKKTSGATVLETSAWSAVATS